MTKVLLVCDFYEEKKIPNEVFTVKKNITLFPISNIPLIEYILEHLYKNNFLDVILVGTTSENIFEYLKRTKYYRIMRIDCFPNEYNSFGDILRDIDERDLRYENLLVYYANTFVNYDLNLLYKKHLENQKKDKKLICTTILMESKPTNINHFYVCNDKDVLYSSEHNKKGNLSVDIWSLVEKHENVYFISHLSKSRVFLITNEMFSLFSEYFDCKTLEDVINELYLLNPYDYKIHYIKNEDMPILSETTKNQAKNNIPIDKLSLQTYSFTSKIISSFNQSFSSFRRSNSKNQPQNIFSNEVFTAKQSKIVTQNAEKQTYISAYESYATAHESYASSHQSFVSTRQTIESPTSEENFLNFTTPYSKSIKSIQDYFEINDDFKKLRKSPKLFEKFINIKEKEYITKGNNYVAEGVSFKGSLDQSILGHSEISQKSSVISSNVCNGCRISANLQNCILWDDVDVKKNLKECLVISNNEDGIIYLNNLDEEDESETNSEDSSENTFFNDTIDYLTNCFEEMDNCDIDIEDVLKNVNLLRISWNASNLDLVEAFGVFLCRTYAEDSSENTIIKTSCFFPIINGLTDEPNAQDLLLTSLIEHFDVGDIQKKKEFLIRYWFLFLEGGIITKSVLKKYKNLMKMNRI